MTNKPLKQSQYINNTIKIVCQLLNKQEDENNCKKKVCPINCNLEVIEIREHLKWCIDAINSPYLMKHTTEIRDAAEKLSSRLEKITGEKTENIPTIGKKDRSGEDIEAEKDGARPCNLNETN